MDHVAIMKKSKGLLPLILSGEKTIESRWYMARIAPWGRIAAGDTVYFKNSGESISLKARVSSVEEYLLTPEIIRNILNKKGAAIGIGSEFIDSWYSKLCTKRYGILIHLCDVEKVVPFGIDKRSFGMMAAWICIDDIGRIKR